MVEYRKSLWVALTNLLALFLTTPVLALFLDNILARLPVAKETLTADIGFYRGGDDKSVVPEFNLLAIFLLIFFAGLTIVFHWWKHRDKYKKFTKVKALLGILFIGLTGLVTYVVAFLIASAGTFVPVIIMVSLAGVISDLLWQFMFKPKKAAVVGVKAKSSLFGA